MVSLPFADGFESGDLTAWTAEEESVITGSVLTNQVKEGTYSYEIVSSAQLGYADVYADFTAEDELYARFYLRFSAVPADEGENWHFIDLNTTGQSQALRIGLEYESGALKWHIELHEDTGWTDENKALVGGISVDTWYCFEVYRKKGTGADGVVTFWQDGSQEFTYTSLDMDTDGGTTQVALGITNMNDAGTFNWYLDSCKIETSRINCIVAGWTGKIIGVTNPAKINGIAVANISKVLGVS